MPRKVWCGSDKIEVCILWSTSPQSLYRVKIHHLLGKLLWGKHTCVVNTNVETLMRQTSVGLKLVLQTLVWQTLVQQTLSLETFVRQTLLWLTPRPPTHPTGPLDPQNCPDPSRPARNRLPRQTLLRHIVLQ